jgi:hypothetical protein
MLMHMTWDVLTNACDPPFPSVSLLIQRLRGKLYALLLPHTLLIVPSSILQVHNTVSLLIQQLRVLFSRF